MWVGIFGGLEGGLEERSDGVEVIALELIRVSAQRGNGGRSMRTGK